jgi:hypothetical protein
MSKTTVVLIVLCAAVSLGQTTDTSQSSTTKQPKKSNDEVTVRGCLSKLSSDYVLNQPDEGNSYELQGSRKMRLGPYLGQEVEVTGVQQPSMMTSADYLTKTGAATSVTIVVHSIKSIAKRCSN